MAMQPARAQRGASCIASNFVPPYVHLHITHFINKHCILEYKISNLDPGFHADETEPGSMPVI
jgi:hypothetical protein